LKYHAFLAALVSRIEVQRTRLVLSLKPTDRSTEAVMLGFQRQIYRACYGLLVVIALKLLWDGVSGYIA
jgi:hypothetical protein